MPATWINLAGAEVSGEAPETALEARAPQTDVELPEEPLGILQSQLDPKALQTVEPDECLFV